MMLLCWERITRDRSSSGAGTLLLILLVSAVLLPGQSLESLAKAYREKPSPARRDALLRYASAHPKDQAGALALLSVGVTEAENGQYEEGARRLKALGARLPQLRDYVAYYLGSAQFGLKDLKSVAGTVEPIWKASPPSALAGKAALLAARALLENGAPTDAVRLLKEHNARLPQPEGAAVLAGSLEAAGDMAAAAGYYQQVYYGYPLRPEASNAESSLERLRQSLGAAYPPPMPAAMLERAEKLTQAGEYGKARAELRSLVDELDGEQRELAQVGLGVVDYTGGQTRPASSYLGSLRLDSPEADAKRLYYMVASARRLDDRTGMLAYVDELARRHPRSEWRLAALIWAANDFLLENDPLSYEPLFRTCYESFPGEQRASYCHWKIVWNRYLRRDPRAADLLREHLTLFPKSDKIEAALFFLGQLSEREGNLPAARGFYDAIVQRFPGHYYAAAARGRLSDRRLAQVRSGGSANGLESYRLPRTSTAPDFQPSAGSRVRIERGGLLARAGLNALAEAELRFGATNGGQPHVLALELARLASRQGEYGRSIRYIKGVFPGYLSVPRDSAPGELWRLAFPLPYRRELERYCRIHKLDLWLVAGLIRQESEFDPNALSRAGARGLMQILPSTGRQLSRKLGVRRFGTSMLNRPEFNIRLGTYYFRWLLDEHSGNIEAALASYNGGKRRAVDWLGWADFEDAVEFVETIPITETRGYVQAVLRNAAVYRELYGGEAAGVTSTNGDSSRSARR